MQKFYSAISIIKIPAIVKKAKYKGKLFKHFVNKSMDQICNSLQLWSIDSHCRRIAAALHCNSITLHRNYIAEVEKNWLNFIELLLNMLPVDRFATAMHAIPRQFDSMTVQFYIPRITQNCIPIALLTRDPQNTREWYINTHYLSSLICFNGWKGSCQM